MPTRKRAGGARKASEKAFFGLDVTSLTKEQRDALRRTFETLEVSVGGKRLAAGVLKQTVHEDD